MTLPPFPAFPSFFRRALSAGILSGLAAVPAGLAQESQSFPINEDNGSTVEVTNVFSAVPPGGYTALRITVINKGKEEISVVTGTASHTPARSTSHTLNGPPAAFSCKPESTTTREITVPLMTDFSARRSYQDNSLTVNLTAGGRSFSAIFRTNGAPGRPFWAISQSLGGASAASLNDAARKAGGSSGSSYGGGERFAGSFLPAQLPSDWRAFTGLDGLALNADEWNALQPGVRTAIRQWVLLGGTLDLHHNGPAPAGILQEMKTGAPAQGRHPLGYGSVKPVVWDGVELGQDDLSQFENVPDFGWRVTAARESMATGDKAQAGAGLPQSMGERSFAAWQVGLILLIFGILVGPVNLFYFAAPGRRHRLFFTTPVIALGASVVLIAVIFLQDGSGGKGFRAALMELHPDENLASIRQYQISRTGVLFGGGFVMDEPAVLTPLLMEPSRWTRLRPSESGDSEAQRFNLPEPQAYAGDWFQSRSEQAQLVETVRPGRGRVELRPGANPPVLTSSLTGTLQQVFYQDPTGIWWAGTAPLATGGSATLQKSSQADFDAWLKEQLQPFPPAIRSFFTRRAHAGRFYAVSHDRRIGLPGTLQSIDWINDHALVHGRLAPVP